MRTSLQLPSRKPSSRTSRGKKTAPKAATPTPKAPSSVRKGTCKSPSSSIAAAPSASTPRTRSIDDGTEVDDPASEVRSPSPMLRRAISRAARLHIADNREDIPPAGPQAARWRLRAVFESARKMVRQHRIVRMFKAELEDGRQRRSAAAEAEARWEALHRFGELAAELAGQVGDGRGVERRSQLADNILEHCEVLKQALNGLSGACLAQLRELELLQAELSSGRWSDIAPRLQALIESVRTCLRENDLPVEPSGCGRGDTVGVVASSGIETTGDGDSVALCGMGRQPSLRHAAQAARDHVPHYPRDREQACQRLFQTPRSANGPDPQNANTEVSDICDWMNSASPTPSQSVGNDASQWTGGDHVVEFFGTPASGSSSTPAPKHRNPALVAPPTPLGGISMTPLGVSMIDDIDEMTVLQPRSEGLRQWSALRPSYRREPRTGNQASSLNTSESLKPHALVVSAGAHDAIRKMSADTWSPHFPPALQSPSPPTDAATPLDEMPFSPTDAPPLQRMRKQLTFGFVSPMVDVPFSPACAHPMQQLQPSPPPEDTVVRLTPQSFTPAPRPCSGHRSPEPSSGVPVDVAAGSASAADGTVIGALSSTGERRQRVRSRPKAPKTEHQPRTSLGRVHGGGPSHRASRQNAKYERAPLVVQRAGSSVSSCSDREKPSAGMSSSRWRSATGGG